MPRIVGGSPISPIATMTRGHLSTLSWSGLLAVKPDEEMSQSVDLPVRDGHA